MMRSMYSGVSGLKNHQTRMDVIGNNIANINTAGFKKSRVVFQDTLYQTMRGASRPDGDRGGTNPMGIGLGMSVSSIDQIHSGAPTMNTNKITDMAVDGNGYFIVSDGKQEYYTRAGNFEFDTSGRLGNPSNGYSVIGWMTTIDPVTGEWSIDTSASNRKPIDIANFKKCPPQETREMVFSGNLNADTPFNEVQTLSFATPITTPPTPSGGGTAGGEFRLSFSGQDTQWIKVGNNPAETAANIQKALENLGSIGEDNVAVSWNSNNQYYEIKFQGDMASRGVPALGVEINPDVTNIFDGGPGTIGKRAIEASKAHILSFAAIPDGGAAGEAFRLDYDGAETAWIEVGADTAATAANIQAALENLTNVGTGNVAVKWNDAAEQYEIRMQGALAAASPTIGVTAYDTGFDGGAGELKPPVGDVFYPTDNQSVITSQKVYDVLGNDETLYFRFFKYDIDEGPPRVSRWAVDISLNNPLFEKNPNYQAITGFDSVDLDSAAPAALLNANNTEIIRLTNLQFNDKGQVVGGMPDLDPFILTLDRSDKGADDIEFKMDFSIMSQYASESVNEIFQNGNTDGNLISYSIGIDGVIRGSYDNGETRDLARVALASFQNSSGLTQVGGTIFQESVNSGQARIGSPTALGMGKIVPSSLEMSNVDLSEEFTDMIVTQRGFQANSRIITTSDEMIQELVNLKR